MLFRSSVDDYKVQNRGGKGLITYKVSDKTGRLIGVTIVNDEHDLLIITDQGVIIRVSAGEIPTLSRATSGVRLMRSKDAKIVDFALTDHEAETEDAAEGEAAADVSEAEAEISAENSAEDAAAEDNGMDDEK